MGNRYSPASLAGAIMGTSIAADPTISCEHYKADCSDTFSLSLLVLLGGGICDVFYLVAWSTSDGTPCSSTATYWKYQGLCALRMLWLIGELPERQILDEEAAILKATLTFLHSALCAP